MAITLFILLFSIGLLALLTVLLHLKKISAVVFAAMIAMLTVFDYALLSLDKIYFLHQEQDRAIETQLKQQKDVMGQLTQVQLDMTLQLLSQASSQDNETSIAKKLQWRDLLLAQLRLAQFQQVKIEQVESQINHSVHVYLMEQLNKQLIQDLGHRIYSDFVRSRPRDEWTDELFINDLLAYLEKESLMKPGIQSAILRVQHFDQTGELKPKN